MRPRQIFRIIIVAILVLFLLLSWCAADRDAAYTVFFGRDIGDTGFVSDADWAAFEKDVVAPALGQYTVLDGRGGYLPEGLDDDEDDAAGDGQMSAGDQEQTIILLFVTPDTEDARDRIESTAEDYKDQFSQQSVLVIKTAADIVSGSSAEDDDGGGLFARIVVALIFVGLIVALFFGRPSRDMWE